MNTHVEAAPIGGRMMTPAVRVFAGVFGLGALMIVWRLAAGLGATTALNDGYPLGLWIAFDVVTGTALACGGYAVALLVYVINKGRYSPLVRPALLTSALGYTLAGIGVSLDVGRWWLLWKVPLYFWHWNFNSALLEVALCIMAYIVVLWIELSPAFFERFRNDSDHLALRRLSRAALPVLEKASVWIVALGLLLPTMHQSSLGTLMLLANWRLHPLWNSPVVPLLFLLSCLSMGYAVVVFESAFSAVALKRPPETKMLASLAAAIVPVQLVVVLIRAGDIVARGQAGLLVAADVRSALVWLEVALFAAPVVMLWSDEHRRNLGRLVRAAMVMMFAGALYRFDVYLVAFMPGAHWSYFPSVPELLVSVGLVALEIATYIVIVKSFPILAGAPRRSTAERQAA
jgi:Ni/Fe-hydrogenase subunit HybB-like protein